MFNRSPTPSGPVPHGSPLTRCLSMLGTAGGVAAAILLTPLLFSLTEHWLSGYLTNAWGGFAALLTLAMGVICAVVLFAVTKILIISGLTAAIVSLAARTSPSA